MKIGRKLAVILVLFLISAVSYAAELNIGDQAVDFSQNMSWFGGEKISLKDNIGRKVTLLYFLKPGCGSCDSFAPHLQRLMLKNKDSLQVIGITEYPDNKIAEYLQKRMGSYPVVQDLDRSFMSKYIGVINKYPYVAVINKAGELSWFGRGKFHSHVTEEVNRALGEETTDTVDINTDIKKNALIVGVDYSELILNKLSTPENNAVLVGKALDDAGYDAVSVITGSTITRDAIQEGIRALAAESGEGDTAVFYFSGDAKPNPMGDGSIDLKLYLADSSLSLKSLVDEFNENTECENLLVIIDGNNEMSTLKVWEDIAADVGKAMPGATIMLSAARWDRSHITGDGEHTIFSEMLADSLENSSADMTPYSLWREIRDKMSSWSRPHGNLQSPFIANSADFSIGKSE